MNSTQLLCTFCTKDSLDTTIKYIIDTYSIAFDSIYVLENVEVADQYCVTYNIDTTVAAKNSIPEATISLHRKKATNTLYTINALNCLIKELNNGKLDKSYKVPWNEYNNTILVTAYNKLKRIDTKLHKIIKPSEC